MIFGFLKKKPDKAKVAVETIFTVLHVQLTLGRGTTSLVSSDSWALGYIFGFHDGVLQALQINDQTKSLAIMGVSYDKLFGGVLVGGRLLRQCIDLQRDQVFMDGVLVGGGEAVAYLRDETPPLGLASRLQTAKK